MLGFVVVKATHVCVFLCVLLSAFVIVFLFHAADGFRELVNRKVLSIRQSRYDRMYLGFVPYIHSAVRNPFWCDGRHALGGWYVVVQRCASVRGVQLPRRRGDATSNVAVVIERQQRRDVTVGAVTAVLVGGGGAVEQPRHGDTGRSVGVPRGDGANEGPV